MEVNQLILLAKKKNKKKILKNNVFIKDKTYLHTKHSSQNLIWVSPSRKLKSALLPKIFKSCKTLTFVD